MTAAPCNVCMLLQVMRLTASRSWLGSRVYLKGHLIQVLRRGTVIRGQVCPGGQITVVVPQHLHKSPHPHHSGSDRTACTLLRLHLSVGRKLEC